ncbi:DNA gyrase subunit A [Desulfohalotomaculum tongense]|uniref:DNA gyrase subunit A n=1 Tax=Desulforadius tongensis TaxID=1216062 RepID=UPI001958518B|nr:DNA gyrase subunit A [Desulforadius tongensis]MBM7855836.1 DNA gyrase subunit A [Desulforadius tongensis]
MPELTGKVLPIDIDKEMRQSYLDYAMSVIVGRALPDVKDGLKPVHRRILYSMYELGLYPGRPHRKCANIVGKVMSDFHPHGDAAIYDTLVRLAQDFSCRYPLVDGHGNFGSVDGDAAAAMRYTEARMAEISMEMVRDIDKDTVDFVPNYDERKKEPVILPSRIPNLLINGSAGIAVGMATNIPPHNLAEVVDGVKMLIKNPDTTIDELMTVIKGPDFPTGAKILGRKGIESAYRTGRGSITIRANAVIEDIGKGKKAIIIDQLPYQVNKARLIEKIADLVKDKKIDGITDLRDESDRTGMRVVIELRRDANAKVILNRLYKQTQLQDTFGVIMLALVDGTPRVLNLKEVLFYYLEHQKEVIVRRTKYELDKAEARAHIVEGLRIAVANIDEVVQIIKSSKTTSQAKEGLIKRFELSAKQAEAIVEMRLRSLTGLEIEKLEAEYKELLEKIDYLKSILADEKKVLGIIDAEITEISKKYADKRRTIIVNEETDFEDYDLIPKEDVAITLTNYGYIKRIPLDTYRSQRRGGRGISGMVTKEEDAVKHVFATTTHHFILFFTTKGKVYRLKAHEIPESGRQAKGTAIVNLLYLDSDEQINAVIPVQQFDDKHFLFMCTSHGIVKKTSLIEFDTSRRDGIIAIKLDEGDCLVNVLLTHGNEEVILGTKNGLAIRFFESDVRAMGRASRGVKGINLAADDLVVGMDKVRKDAYMLVVTANGFGKRTSIDEYRSQTRGGKGIINIKTNQRTGETVDLHVVREDEEILLVSSDGVIIRLETKYIPVKGRATQGVTLMRLAPGDKVVAMAKFHPEPKVEN